VLDRNYKLFGVMEEADADLKADVSKTRSLRGFINNDKSLMYEVDGEEVRKVFCNLRVSPFRLLSIFVACWIRFELALSNTTAISSLGFVF